MLIFVSLLNIAIFQGIILSLIILKSPFFKSKGNNFLAYTILTLSLLLLNLVFEVIGAYDIVPILQILDNVEWGFIFPVFFFLFAENQINNPLKKSKIRVWLFVPFWYSLIINGLETIFHSNLNRFIYDILSQIDFFLILIFLPFIITYTYTIIKSSKDKQEKKWMTILWFLISFFQLSWLLSIIITLLFDYDIFYIMKILALFVAFIIHWTAYIGIYKFKLAKDKEAIRKIVKQETPTPFSHISPEEKNLANKEIFTKENHYYKKLEKLCKEQHIYKDTSLDRVKVAEKLDISVGYLSQIINTIRNENFNTYINTYRVEAVKKMIVDSEFDNYSLLAISMEAGFTSKTTFNKSFKKITGITPNEYRVINK
ncbi:helix-turn-helix domain-containing protein [Tenacibaculum soleae]|uniref:helix-turn-helix domain-containing protein n=1 Tax=Tenacibaculum soleae TaxID=447689 RepID=UPI0022FFD5CB|nr:helix-turn-helix domain-containing protein [Tenacibaculum soleae]